MQHWLDAEQLFKNAKMALAKEAKPIKTKVKPAKPGNPRKLAAA